MTVKSHLPLVGPIKKSWGRRFESSRGRFLYSKMSEIKLGKYQHFKGKLYKILGVAKHSETLEEFVIYQALYDSEEFGKNQIWIRPLKMFLEEVEVNGQKVPRFKFIE